MIIKTSSSNLFQFYFNKLSKKVVIEKSLYWYIAGFFVKKSIQIYVKNNKF